MQGIFVSKCASGYEVIRVDNGHFPMDHFKHRYPAERYGREMAKHFGLRLFVEEPVG